MLEQPTTSAAHPLSGISKADLELFLAQAIAELTGSNATVQLSTMALGTSGDASLQLYVKFPQAHEDDGDTPY